MFVDTAKISLPPLPRRLADQQPQHLCLDVNSVKDISLNVFHQQSTSGALRQIGKKASKGPDKLGILPLSSRDNIFLSSGEMSISSSEQLKGLPRPWWRRKLSNLTGKNEDTRTREHRIFFLSIQHTHWQKWWKEERRPEENTDCWSLQRQSPKPDEHHLTRWGLLCSSSSIVIVGLTLANVTQNLRHRCHLLVRGCRTTETFYRTVTPIGHIWLVWLQIDCTHKLRACPGSLASCSLLAAFFTVDSVPQPWVQEECPPTLAFVSFLLTQLFTSLKSLRNQGPAAELTILVGMLC